MEDAMLIFAFTAALLAYFVSKQALTFMGMGHPVAAGAVAALTFMALHDNEIGVPIMASYGAFGLALVLILLLMLCSALSSALFKNRRDNHSQALNKDDVGKHGE